MMTTARMMITSEKLSFSTTARTPLMAAAASRMRIMGSAICSKKRRIRGFPFSAFRRFFPFFSSRRRASSVVRPFSVVSSDCSTVSFSLQ